MVCAAAPQECCLCRLFVYLELVCCNGLRLCFGAGLAIRPDIPHQRAGSQGFSPKLLPMDVVDAEGLDLEQVGEEKTCGKEQ